MRISKCERVEIKVTLKQDLKQTRPLTYMYKMKIPKLPECGKYNFPHLGNCKPQIIFPEKKILCVVLVSSTQET